MIKSNHTMKSQVISFLLVLLMPGVSLAAERIISIDGAITEIIFALDGNRKLVAVDSTSTKPEAAKALPNVGYMRALSTEPMLSLGPDTVIASSAAGPKPVFEQLEQAGVDVHIVDSDYSIQGLYQRIDMVANLLGKQAQGKLLLADIASRLEPVEARLAAHKGEKPKVLFLMAVQSGQWLAAGEQTLADALLGIMQADNVVNHKSYKPVAMESIIEMDADAIVLASSVASAEVPDAVSLMRASRQGRVLETAVEDMLMFGPRLPAALEQLATVIYPQ